MSQKYNIVVLGAGESGVGAAVLAKTRNLSVFVSDNGKIDTKYQSVLTHFEIEFEENGHTMEAILSAGEVVKSPGIPDSIPLIRMLKEQGTSVISEIEFASRFTDAKKICITGSNGKTTTTLLTYHIMKNAGLNVGLAGNVGQSFAMQVALHDFDYYVLEISSFQLDGMFQFKAEVAVLLNITPDHLDRYEYDFQKYVDSKFRILQNQTKNDFFIYWAEDPVILKEMKKRKIKATTVPFGFLPEGEGAGSFIKDKKIVFKNDKIKFDMTLEQLALQGKHNQRNSINDSKATNINATWYALEYVDKPTVWIVGGVDKGNDYETLKHLVKEKVKAIVCLGLDNANIHKAFEDVIDVIVDTESAREAVEASYRLGEKGDIVLLSPACASFDLFENYEDRGNQFKQAVSEL